MIDFAEEKLDLGYDYGAIGGMRFKTTVIKDGEKNEQRNVDWWLPLGRWQLGERTLLESDLDQQEELLMNKRRQKNEGRRQKLSYSEGTEPCLFLTKEVLKQSGQKEEIDLNLQPSALSPQPLRAQPDYHLEQEILELKQSCFELNQELEVVKKLLEQRQLSPKQIFLFIKVLIFILVGINAQGGNFQFNGDHLLPIVDTLSNEEIDN